MWYVMMCEWCVDDDDVCDDVCDGECCGVCVRMCV